MLCCRLLFTAYLLSPDSKDSLSAELGSNALVPPGCVDRCVTHRHRGVYTSHIPPLHMCTHTTLAASLLPRILANTLSKKGHRITLPTMWTSWAPHGALSTRSRGLCRFPGLPNDIPPSIPHDSSLASINASQPRSLPTDL